MPEVLTKYPDVVIRVLQGGGARCGPGQEQKILKSCPPDRFCSTATGETCVYGLDEIGKMTQIQKGELAARVCPASGGGCALLSPGDGVSVTAALAIVLALGAFRRYRRTNSWVHRRSTTTSHC
jgi:hypothetical protein